MHPEVFLELGDASQHGRVVHTEALGGSPHRASARDGKKVANVIPVDHGAIRHRGVCLPKPVSNTIKHPLACGVARAVIIAFARQARPNSEQWTPIVAAGASRPAGSIFAPPMCALPHSMPDASGPMSRFSGPPRTSQRW